MRLDVVRIQRDAPCRPQSRPFFTYSRFWGSVEPRVAIGLVPVVGCHGVVRFGVVRLELGALLNGGDQLREIGLPLIEAGELLVDGRFLRLHFLGLHQLCLGFVDAPGVLVDVGEDEVVVVVAGIELNHPLHDRLRSGRIVQLVWAIGR